MLIVNKDVETGVKTFFLFLIKKRHNVAKTVFLKNLFYLKKEQFAINQSKGVEKKL